MATETIEALIEGGKATAAPPLGPALGPLGVNIAQVISEINKKTDSFKGMQVPVKVTVERETKTFTVTVGTPPVSALIKKEAGIEKGAGNPLQDKVANIRIEQVIKIAKMKEDSLLGRDNFARVKEIVGTCNSMGVMVEGKAAKDTIKDINSGMFREKIIKGKTELTAEELKAIEAEKKQLQETVEKRRAEFTTKAKQIVESMAGRTRAEIKAKLLEAKIPIQLIDELLPVEAAAGAAGEAGKKEAEAAAKAAAPKKEETKSTK